MNIYINGTGTLSPQKTCEEGDFLADVIPYDGNVLTCVLPDFKEYIHPMKLRRLSRILKMGLTAATICLRNAKMETPDAIITSTGYGLQDDIGKFLLEILRQEEQQLTPTYFMQSTYNAMAGLIALSVRCIGYNNTHVSRGFAFESALDDAMLLLQEREAQDVLVGAFDEVSPVLCSSYARKEYLKIESGSNLKLFDSKTAGTLLGEGVAFFLLSSSLQPHTLCRLKDVRMLYKPADYGELSKALVEFLRENFLEPSDIDVFINGAGGDVYRDSWNMAIRRDFLQSAVEVRFKHLTGEYATASSFGLWLGAGILNNRQIPDAVRMEPLSRRRPIKTILFCNHFLARNYTFMLMERLDIDRFGT